MPTRAPIACPQPGCPNVQPCPDHPRRRWADGDPGKPDVPGWAATRRRVLARDGHRCRSCGGQAAEVHHTVPGREDDASLIALCTACHAAVTAAQAAHAREAARP